MNLTTLVIMTLTINLTLSSFASEIGDECSIKISNRTIVVTEKIEALFESKGYKLVQDNSSFVWSFDRTCKTNWSVLAESHKKRTGFYPARVRSSLLSKKEAKREKFLDSCSGVYYDFASVRLKHVRTGFTFSDSVKGTGKIIHTDNVKALAALKNAKNVAEHDLAVSLYNESLDIAPRNILDNALEITPACSKMIGN